MMKYEESSVLELKREINIDFKKEIIAFANTNGGEILVGIDVNGTVVGVANSEDAMARIGNMIRDGIKPDLTAYTSIESFEEEGFRVVRVAVLRGTKRPYHLSDKGMKPGGVFVRHGVSSVPATEEAIRQMIRDNDGVAFDVSRSVNQDLTFLHAQDYFIKSNVSFSESNKRTLRLIDSDGYFTNAALLLSDQCEYSVKCAVYEGNGKTNFKARKEFPGSILKQVDEAYEYLSLHNNQNSTFNGLKRVDHPDYPPYAIREALLNAIVHRDYDYTGSTIINLYDNRIEFVSLGGLVKGITMQDIIGGVSQPRNMIIANIFYRLELIESYGTGIQRIIESYENAINKPEFNAAPASFVVILPKLVSFSDTDSSLSNEEKILKMLLENGSITRRDVEKLLSCSKFPAITALNRLVREKKIKKEGSARSVKYTQVK